MWESKGNNCVCVCVCVRERERERESEGGTVREHRFEQEAVKQGTGQGVKGGPRGQREWLALADCLYIEKTESDRADPVRE